MLFFFRLKLVPLLLIIVITLVTKATTDDDNPFYNDDDEEDVLAVMPHAVATGGAGRREGSLLPDVYYRNYSPKTTIRSQQSVRQKPATMAHVTEAAINTTEVTTQPMITTTITTTTLMTSSSSSSPIRTYSPEISMSTGNNNDNGNLSSEITTATPKASRRVELRSENRKPDVPTVSAMATLLHNIFHQYKKEIIPDKPVYVQMDLLLLKVKTTIEREGILETVIALLIEWQDSRFIWDPAVYDNVTILAFDSYRIWLPDIAMTNSADHLYTLSRDPRFVVRVSHDGRLKFVPTGTARTWCALNLQAFPFDVQTCSIDFESWSLDSSMMSFNDTASLLVDESFASTQWTFCNHRTVAFTHDYYTGETFGCLRYEFVLKRKSTFYVINLIFPCATLSFIQLLSFIIPSTRSTSDRIGFGTTNLLTLVVFQTIVTAEMPKSNEFTTLSKYVISLIIISSLGIMQSVVVERILHISARPPPKLVLKILRRISPFLPALWQQPVSANDSSQQQQQTTREGYHNHKKKNRLGIIKTRKNDKSVGTSASLFSQQSNNLSIGRAIAAGSSVLATAAVVVNKKEMWKRRESKAAYLKKMTAGGEQQIPIQQQQPSPVPSPRGCAKHNVNEHVNKRRTSATVPASSSPRQYHRKTSHPILLLKPPEINYEAREEEENRRILTMKMESGLLGRSPTSIIKDDSSLIGLKKHVRLSILEEVLSSTETSSSSAVTSVTRTTTTAGRRSNITIETASSWLFKEPSNDELWAELVTRLDALTIALCIFLSICIPSSLFLPLYFREDNQCLDV